MGVDERVEVEDDLEVEARPPKAEASPERGVFNCPECRVGLTSPEELGAHLERHAPIGDGPKTSPRGHPLTAPCPKGCGRHFSIKRGAPEGKNHAKICDGQPPIVGAAAQEETGESPKEDQVANKFECPDCGGKFPSPRAVGQHRRYNHSGAAAAGKAKPSPRAKALAKRLKADRDETQGEPGAEEEAPVGGGEKLPLLLVDKDQPILPIRQRVLDLLELEEDRLTKELGKTKSLIAAVRNAVPEEKGEERPTAEE